MKKLLAGLTLSSALLLAACGSDDAADTAAFGSADAGPFSCTVSAVSDEIFHDDGRCLQDNRRSS